MTRALLLVAHPDDEVLFAGGLILSHPEWEWHVACMTYSRRHPRGFRLQQSLNGFKARGCQMQEPRHMGIEDNGVTTLSLPTYEHQLLPRLRALGQLEWDIIITHNRLGEYGHPHHIALHAGAAKILAGCAPMWTFYCTAPSSVGEQEEGEFRHTVQLDKGLVIPKSQIMEHAYPDEMLGIALNQPALGDYAFGQVENFTSHDGGWPA